jgi:hypothetical protein
MTEIIEPTPARIDQQHLPSRSFEAGRAEGVELVGPGGLLAGLTKTVLEIVRPRPHPVGRRGVRTLGGGTGSVRDPSTSNHGRQRGFAL